MFLVCGLPPSCRAVALKPRTLPLCGENSVRSSHATCRLSGLKEVEITMIRLLVPAPCSSSLVPRPSSLIPRLTINPPPHAPPGTGAGTGVPKPTIHATRPYVHCASASLPVCSREEGQDRQEGETSATRGAQAPASARKPGASVQPRSLSLPSLFPNQSTARDLSLRCEGSTFVCLIDAPQVHLIAPRCVDS